MSTSYCLRCGEVCDFPPRYYDACMEKDAERWPPSRMPPVPSGTFVRKGEIRKTAHIRSTARRVGVVCWRRRGSK